jgi:hypothetical protein
MVGGYAVLTAFLRDLQNIWPLQPSVANWRFGALGFLIGTGALPVLGLALMAVVAALGEKRWLGRAVAVVGLVLGVGMVLGLILFLVDSRSLLANAGGDATTMIRGAVRRTAAIGVLTGPAYLALGIAGLKAASGRTTRPKQGRPDLIVGSATA